METVEEIKLDTVGDVMITPKFKELLDEFFKKIRRTREEMLNASESIDARLKSDAFGRLDKEGKLNFEFIFNEFDLILQKKSELPAQERMFIQSLVDDCIRKTIAHYQKQ